jgi:uncharacterized membrane protein AbrB (regulator of aidB expression)
MTPALEKLTRIFRHVTSRDILHTFETLLIGLAGGAFFQWLELPGGLISGAMIAVGAAAIAGRPMGLPPHGGLNHCIFGLHLVEHLPNFF